MSESNRHQFNWTGWVFTSAAIALIYTGCGTPATDPAPDKAGQTVDAGVDEEKGSTPVDAAAPEENTTSDALKTIQGVARQPFVPLPKRRRQGWLAVWIT